MNGKIIGAVNNTAMSPTAVTEEEAKCLNSSNSELAKSKDELETACGNKV